MKCCCFNDSNEFFCVEFNEVRNGRPYTNEINLSTWDWNSLHVYKELKKPWTLKSTLKPNRLQIILYDPKYKNIGRERARKKIRMKDDKLIKIRCCNLIRRKTLLRTHCVSHREKWRTTVCIILFARLLFGFVLNSVDLMRRLRQGRKHTN